MRKVSKPWLRGAVSLAVLVGLAAALVASPVGAFDPGDKRKVKRIARKQAKKQVNKLASGIATNVFDQKIGSASVANAANAGTLDNIDSTAFVQNQGDILVGVGHHDWVAEGPGAGFTDHRSLRAQLERGAAGDARFGVSGDAPTALYGKRLALKGVEYCYNVRLNATIDQAELFVQTHSVGTHNLSPVATDPTNRTDEACRTLFPPSPVTLTENDYVSFALDVAYSAAGRVDVSRVTFILTPTSEAAVTPSR
ncbi:MAG: hypothetical protein ACRDH8_00215 [Actinomycetota bacterium]